MTVWPFVCIARLFADAMPLGRVALGSSLRMGFFLFLSLFVFCFIVVGVGAAVVGIVIVAIGSDAV